jgi:hypothetical protein
MEEEFNTNKYRGALFHLNFHASEKQRYLKKLRRLKKNASVIRDAELYGKLFATNQDSMSP